MAVKDVFGVQLQSGDWFEMEYGFSRITCYVLWATEREVRWCKRGWLVSCANTEPIQKIAPRKPSYIGRGKRRWFTYLFTPNLLCPFTRPSAWKSPAVKPPTIYDAPRPAQPEREEWPEYVEGGWR